MWKGIVGKLFTLDAFETYLDRLAFGLWRPRFVVVHNTASPDLATFNKWQTRNVPVPPEQWARNLEVFYRDKQKWSAGPHLFVTPLGILVFTPLTVPGTHSPSWNEIAWGVETVGDFERERFEGPVRDNLIVALGLLHAKSGLQLLPYQCSVRGLHFHKEDPKTNHRTCPGRNMDKAKLIGDVHTWMMNHHAGEHAPALTS